MLFILNLLHHCYIVWINLGKHLLFVWLCVSSIETGTKRVIRTDELYQFSLFPARIRRDWGQSRRTEIAAKGKVNSQPVACLSC